MQYWRRTLKERLLAAVALRPLRQNVGSGADWPRLNLKWPRQTKATRTRSTKRVKPAVDLFRIETIEPRLLLSADLTPGAEQALLKGFADFAGVLDPASAVHDTALSAVLPMINRNVAEMVDLGSLVQTLKTSASAYFEAPGQATTAGLAATLDALSQTIGAVTTTTQGSVEKFSLTVTDTFDPAPYILDLSGAVQDLDLTVQGTQNLTRTGQHSLTFSFGIDTATNQFLLYPGNFSASLNATGSNLNFGLIFGVADTQVAGASANLAATVSGNIVDPGNLDGLGIITSSELAATPVDFLLNAQVAGTGALTLPVSGGILPHAETVSIGWSGNLGPTTAAISYAQGSTLTQLASLTHDDLSSVLQQAFTVLPTIFADVGPQAVGSNIPVLGSNVSDLIDLSDAFKPLTQSLPNFHSLGDLKSILETRLGGTADFSLSGTALTLSLGVQKTFATTVNAEIATAIAGQDFNFSGQVSVAGTTTGKVTLGISLDPGIADGDRLYIVEGAGSFVQLDVTLNTPSPISGDGHLGGALVDVESASFAVSGAVGNILLPNSRASVHVDFVDRSEVPSDGKIKLRDFTANPDRALGNAVVTGVARFEAQLRAAYAPGEAPVGVTVDWSLASASPQVTVDSAALQRLVPDRTQLLTSSQVSASALDTANLIADLAAAVSGQLATDGRLTGALALIGSSPLELLQAPATLAAIGNALKAAIGAAGTSTDGFGARFLAQLTTSIAGANVTVDVAGTFAGLFSAATSDAANALGFATAGNRLIYNVRFTIDRLTTPAITGVTTSGARGVTLSGNLSVHTITTFDLTVGLDLDSTLSAADRLLLRVNNLDQRIQGGFASPAAASVGVGIFDPTESGATLTLDGRFLIGLGGLGAAAPFLSLNEIAGQASGLVDVNVVKQTLSGSVGLTFKAPLQGVSGYLLISGSLLEPDKLSLALVRSAGNSPSQTDPLLLSLASFTTGDLLQSLADAVQWVSRFSDGEMLRAPLPIVDATFGSVLDAGNFFEQRIMAAFEDETASRCSPIWTSSSRGSRRSAGSAQLFSITTPRPTAFC